ncbi:hypothetical protein [Parasphingorhabdus sp.]|uniref:hypothetical protein n=1 Tax=Parasphingorhabdus sp. TaxID=2709688 RepID=UPI0010FCDF21
MTAICSVIGVLLSGRIAAFNMPISLFQVSPRLNGAGFAQAARDRVEKSSIGPVGIYGAKKRSEACLSRQCGDQSDAQAR